MQMNANIKMLLTSPQFWVAIAQGVLGVLVVVGTELPAVGWIAIAKSVLDIAIHYGTNLE